MLAQKRLALIVELIRILKAFTRLVFFRLLLVIGVTLVFVPVVNVLLLVVLHGTTIEGDIDSALAEVLTTCQTAQVNMSVDSESLEHLLDVLRNIGTHLLRVKLLLLVHMMLV